MSDSFNNLFNSDVWSTIGQIAMILAGGGLVLMLEHVRQRAIEWYRYRKLHPIARSVLANRKVHTLLVELRTKTGADRAYVYLFHNGQTFSNKNPLWRMSCTQESCRQGISHEIDHLQNVLASTVWDGIAPLFGHDADVGNGVRAITHHKNKVYIYDIHAMNDSYFKRSLIARGIRTKIVTPIIDHRREVVGFVALNYCTDEAHITTVDKVVEDMAEVAGGIHYALIEE